MRTALTAVILLTLPLFAANQQSPAFLFEQNLGQTCTAVRYLGGAGGSTWYFTDSEVILAGRNNSATFDLAGANPASQWEALDAASRTTSYRIGRDRSRWVENVPGYGRLLRRDVYPGIDLVFYGNGNRLEYDFVIAPHADPSRIRLRFPNARALAIADDGSLKVEMAGGTMRQEKPHLFETRTDGSRREVAGGYRIEGGEVSFRVGVRDPALELSIDPVLDSSTFLGGSGDDSIIFSNGNITVGNTNSLDLPGAYGRRNGTSVFVQIGSNTVVFGGTGNMVATSASVGITETNSVLVGGYTDARDLPTTSEVYPYLSPPAWQPQFAGGATDGFLLFYSFGIDTPGTFLTYVGTPGEDRITAVSNNGVGFLAAGSTDGRGLPYNSAPTYQGVSAEAASGVDGFLIAGENSGFLANTIYFGGSGNDWPMAVYLSSLGYYVAGETTSVDFPTSGGLPSALHGVSDAFVVRFASTVTAILYGGSSNERATTLTQLYDGTIVLAGVTSSSDLPLQNPAQSSYGGGISDAFLSMFAPDLSALKYATYIGGSGADEATSVATDSETTIYLGGWTSSLDFPTLSPLQALYGGGPSDGFVARYDVSGNLQDSTYFGGSGRDQVLGVYALGGPNVTVSGQTTSADLPLMNATQSTLDGPSDGFLAVMASKSIAAPAVIDGQDLRAYGGFLIGNTPSAAGVVVTVTTSDPATVQVALNLGDPGQTSIQVPAGGFSYYVDCLQSSGGASLTLSATGYANVTVPVSCYPAGIIYSDISSLQAGRSTSLYATLVVAADVYGSPIEGVRPGASAISLQIASSNSAVVTASPATITFPPVNGINTGNQASTTITAGVAGTANLQFTARGATVGSLNPMLVTVGGVSTVFDSYTIAAGYQTEIDASYVPTQPGQPLTITSQDPSLILLANGDAGSASITLTPPVTGVVVQAVGGTGMAGLTLSVPGQAPTQISIQISPPVLVLPYSTPHRSPLSIGVGQTVAANAGVGVTTPTESCCFLPISGKNGGVTVTSSNPQVVSVPAAPLSIGQNGLAGFTITGVAPGEAVVTVQPPAGVAIADGSGSFAVKVSNKPMLLSSIEVGNNLAAQMTLTLPFAATANGTAQVTSSNPSLVLLAPDLSTGQAQIGVPISSGQSSVSFYVYGLAASGQSQITASLSGLGSVVATATLDPSGFAWSASTTSVVLYNAPNLPYLGVYALDPATLLPIALQTLRPGITATVTIANNTPTILSLSSSTYTPPYSLPAVGTLSAGTGMLSIVQPVEFTAPSARKVLAVTVDTPTLAPYASGLSYDLQTALTFSNTFPSVEMPLTVTSSDPTRLLVSSSPNAVGSASVTVGISGSGGVTLQALADNGTVTVTASMPTFNSATLSVTLYPTGIGLDAEPISTTTVSSPFTLSPFLVSQSPYASNTLTLRAGVTLSIGVTSSNPAVGAISGSPTTWIGDSSSQPSVTFTPVGAGQTTVAVVEPPGFIFVPAYSSNTVNVAAPTFSTGPLTLGKDTFTQVQAGLSQNVGPLKAGVAVTLTSGDPTALLLSSSASITPGASITTTLSAGLENFYFYVHALGNSGTVPVTISAPGFASATMNVALTDLTFIIGPAYTPDNDNGPLQQNLQPQPLNLPVTAFPVGIPANEESYQVIIRPGVTITVSVTSSDPTTVSVSPAQLVFTGGTAAQAYISAQLLKTGSATLTLGVPAPYVSSAGGTLTINVN